MFSLNKDARIGNLEIRIAIVVIVSLLTYKYIPLVQHVPSTVAAIVCMQEDLNASWKSGITRLLVTVVGGLVGIAVVYFDDLLQIKALFLLLTFIGCLFTLLFCKLVNIPERVGCITFVLTITILSGEARVLYAVYRFLSTFYGVLISVVVTAIWSLMLTKEKKVESKQGKSV